uniref:Uncharacterized protein n=1 Tax=viral metagenome TaxID=1070528 RepID=A0A6C0JQ09_9ZZZZ
MENHDEIVQLLHENCYVFRNVYENNVKKLNIIKKKILDVQTERRNYYAVARCSGLQYDYYHKTLKMKTELKEYQKEKENLERLCDINGNDLYKAYQKLDSIDPLIVSGETLRFI